MSSSSSPPPLSPPPSASSVDLENSTADPKRPLSATKDFGFLPIPYRLRWDPDNPPEFTLLLNVILWVSYPVCAHSSSQADTMGSPVASLRLSVSQSRGFIAWLADLR